MPESYTLTKDKYLYSFIDINTYDADRENPPLKLAITGAGKNIAMFGSDNPITINPDDKLIVHGAEISESDRQKLAKLFYFTGKTLIYKPGWVNGSGYFFFGINCDGCSILCVPQARETPTLVTTFNLPLTFDWSEYNVKVPDSPLTVKQSEVDTLNQKLKEKINELEQQSARGDQTADTNDATIKALRDEQSKLTQELEERKEKLEEKECKIKELEEKISALMRQQEEKNSNLEKLNKELSNLKSQMEETKEEMKEKERTNNELREKQSELERALQEKNQLLQNKFRELEEIESNLKQELDGKNKELEGKENKIKDLEEQQLTLVQQKEEKNQKMENEIASLNQELSKLREEIEKKEKEMMEKEAEINELKGKQSVLERIVQEKENQLEIESVTESKQERQMQRENQEIKKEKEEIEKLKKQLAVLDLQMEEKKTKIAELEKQLQENEAKVTKSDFQLVTNKLDQLLITLQTGHLPPTLLQPLSMPEVVKSRRSQLMPNKFSTSSHNLPQRPQFRVSMKNLRAFTPVGENVDGKFPKEEICVYTSNGRFHDNGWWFIKVAEHSNITMLAYYDGDMDEVSVYGKYVCIPFRPETSFSSNTQFFVGLIRGIGLRFIFLYELI